jgi:hypothetical protein
MFATGDGQMAGVLTKVVKPANDRERHGGSVAGFIMKMGQN